MSVAATMTARRSRSASAFQRSAACFCASTRAGGSARFRCGAHCRPRVGARLSVSVPFAHFDRPAARTQLADELGDLVRVPALRGQREAAWLVLQVLDRRPVKRPRRRGGGQHGLEVGFTRAAGGGAQRVGLAAHLRGASRMPPCNCGWAVRSTCSIATFFCWMALRCTVAQRFRPMTCTATSATSPYRSGRQSGRRNWRHVAHRARAAVLAGQQELAQVPQRAGRQQQALGLGHHDRG